MVIEPTVYTRRSVNTYFTEHGYLSVRVNSRGTGGSGGTGRFGPNSPLKAVMGANQATRSISIRASRTFRLDRRSTEQ